LWIRLDKNIDNREEGAQLGADYFNPPSTLQYSRSLDSVIGYIVVNLLEHFPRRLKFLEECFIAIAQ
jgi:hypothetical protein